MSTANLSLPEDFKYVDATAGVVTTNGGVTCDYISAKHAHKVWIVLQFTQAVGHATVIQPQVATAVLPTGATSITFSAKWWENETTAVGDTLVKQTAATSLTLDAVISKKMVICEIDLSAVAAMGATYDVIGCTISNSAQATNFVAGHYVLAERFAQATPPTAITD